MKRGDRASSEFGGTTAGRTLRTGGETPCLWKNKDAPRDPGRIWGVPDDGAILVEEM